MKRLVLILLFLLAFVGARAQDSFSSSFGLGGEADKEALREINARMDSIRAYRPTVGLVLSGGGAKGAAHVGAIEYIEALGIPVDVVVGTSMGGLIGGLYALGYTPPQMDSILRSLDWKLMLSDKVSRDNIPYETKRYKEKFLISFPFYYSKKDYKDIQEAERPYARGVDKIRMGVAEDNKTTFRRNLLGSLPAGYITGQNVNNLLSSLSVGYQDSTDFFTLPIPFACVSADIISGRAKVWHRGKLVTALRTTMSIPGVFTPVRTEGMLLADGGMRNNFPVDIAREMGADLIIGVDLSQEGKDYSQIRNIADIVWQSIDMLASDSFRRSMQDVDLLIHPELPEYNMMSFSQEAIDTIMNRGKVAARKQEEALHIIKEWVGPDTLVRQAPRAVDIGSSPVHISDIEITGVTEKEAYYIRRRLPIKEDTWVSRRLIEQAVGGLYGSGSFDSVTFELLGTTGPYKLVINCRKGPIHQLGFGARVDTEELVALLLNIGINTNALRGSALNFTTKVGMNPYAEFHYTYNPSRGPTLNAAAYVGWVDRNTLTIGENKFNMSFLTVREELYLSHIKLSQFDFKIGARNETFYIPRLDQLNINGNYDLFTGTKDYVSVFADLVGDTFNKGYFPTAGFRAGVKASYVERIGDKTMKPFGVVQLFGKAVGQIGEHFAMIPSFNARFLFGNNIPPTYANVIGGSIEGRYLDHQVAFIGVDNAAFTRNYLVSARMDFRYRFLRNNYFTLSGNYARDFVSFKQFSDGRNLYGVGLEYAYDSIIGPIKGNIHWSNLYKKVGFYVSIGFDF
ncbi:MAG: patatin-like phospholipase family protein [Bacteroidales bacterium]|nr:patatin-like phospholipase family protein [Bacteroidales bacterium]